MIRAALTVEEALEGMKALEPKIKNYARLVVRKGVNVKPGQEVVVQSPVECAPFARVVVAEAYAAGAGHVTVIWADDAVTRLTYGPGWCLLCLYRGCGSCGPQGHRSSQASRGIKGEEYAVQSFPPWTGLQHQSVVHRRRSGRGLGARGVPGRRR